MPAKNTISTDAPVADGSGDENSNLLPKRQMAPPSSVPDTRVSASKAALPKRVSVPRQPAQGPLPDAKPMAFTATPSLIDTAMPIAPERYGKYHLLERIGVGGMAEVWRAKTLGSEGFTKDLVIKRILPKFTNDEESVRMFIDEARLVAKLHHPNIVQIFDFDKEGDRYYLAMELIEGHDLRQAEKAAAKCGVWFPIPISIYFISEALKGLHYAHTRQDHGKALEIVHRDVSPHNILISFSGDVKISDFGIAKVAERASRETTGTVKGKLAYMSPEQITGQPLDGRTDIYSMGIVFWELLTRHRLFFGPDEHDVIRRVRDGIVPPPRQYNPDIPEEVEKIVMKMLVANRAQRYQSAGEVARQLCALPQYDYEAQGLGEFMRALFPEQTRNWTQVLQNMLSPPAKPIGSADKRSAEESAQVSAAASNQNLTNASKPAIDPPAPRSTMADSEQKTQIATEVPPEVLSALAAQAAAKNAPPAAPPNAGARTIIAGAPPLPSHMSGPPPASPPSLAGPPPPADLPPPPSAPPGGARTVIAEAPILASLPPPPAPAPVAGGPQQATVYAIPSPVLSAPPPSANSGPNTSAPNVSGSRPPVTVPLTLKPASAVFGPTTASAGMPPTLKWVLGPLIAIVIAALTTFGANRLWPKELPSVQIITDPPGADVVVDGVPLTSKTPTEVKGEIGKTIRIRLTLTGYDPYEATIAFAKMPRPVNARLFKVGTRAKALGDSGDEDSEGSTKDGDKDKDDKKAAADSDKKDDKVEKTDKVTTKAEKPAKADKPAEGDDEETGKKKKRRSKEGKESKEAKESDGAKDKGKATLTVLVRPWAIVYIDGKKIQQTPLRNYAISAGSHKLLLVNDSKGKRQEIKIKATAGEAVPEVKLNWE